MADQAFDKTSHHRIRPRKTRGSGLRDLKTRLRLIIDLNIYRNGQLSVENGRKFLATEREILGALFGVLDSSRAKRGAKDPDINSH